MSIQSKTLGILIFVILLGGILFSNYAGWWLTESTKVAAVITEGEFAGMPDPEDIRGSYTFGDVENNFGIPVEVLAEAFNIQMDNPADFAVKDLETQYEDSEFEIGTASVRLFTALYTGLPYDLTLEESYLPGTAVRILKDKPLTTEQLDYLSTHSIELSELSEQTGLPLSNEDETQDEVEMTIKGKTTFAEVLSWGVSEEAIQDILGVPLPEETLVVIKDFVNENGLDFETVKTELQAIVDTLE